MSAYVDEFDVRTSEAHDRYTKVEIKVSAYLPMARSRVADVNAALLRELIGQAIDETVHFILLAPPPGKREAKEAEGTSAIRAGE